MTDLGLIFLHLIGDFVAQTDWMSTKHTNRMALLAHCATYTAIFALAMMASGVVLQTGLIAVSVIFISHMVADAKPWPCGSKRHHKAMAIDQTVHIGILFLISFLVR